MDRQESTRQQVKVPGADAAAAGPMRIRYIVVLPDEDLDQSSVFQGISQALLDMEWAVRLLPWLPSDVFDQALESRLRVSRRVVGEGYSWLPLEISSLERMEIIAEDPFVIVFSGNQDVAARIEAWSTNLQIRPLHVSSTTARNALKPENLDWVSIAEHLRRTAEAIHGLGQDFPRDALLALLEAWDDAEPFCVNMIAQTHNTTYPNLIVLKMLGAEFLGEEKLLAGPENLQAYIDAIAASAEAVIDIADGAGVAPVWFARPPSPDRIVLAPAMLSHTRHGMPRRRDGEPSGMREAIKALQSQTGYSHVGTPETMRWLQEPAAMVVLKARSRELSLQTAVATVRAASTMAPVIRLPNGVNKAADLKRFADHARGGRARRVPDKSPKIFKEAREALVRHVAPELLDLIASSSAGVKLIADAPLEWLPVGDLPLGIARTVSRIPATPGNLMVKELCPPDTLLLQVEAFQTVLLISSFEAGDQLAGMARMALEWMARDSGGRLKIHAVTVNTREEFVAAVNGFHGAMMVFDGHGNHASDSGVGIIRIGVEDVDLWSLRGQLKSPPIVVLSACDTHAPDRTHATVGSGFLACGARAVLATLLPISGDRGAIFAGRLALRATWYAEVVVQDLKRAVLWSEIVGSAIRLDLLSHLIDKVEKVAALSDADSVTLRNRVNMHVHTGQPEWWELSKADLIESLGDKAPQFDGLLAHVLATGDSARYVQLGNPETIRLTSRAIQELELDMGRDRNRAKEAG